MRLFLFVKGIDMSKSKAHVKWIEDALKRHKDDWNISVEISQNGHRKLVFKDVNGNKWMLVMATTSSDPNVRKKEISLIKRNFKKNFDIQVYDDDFSIQMYANKNYKE
jgi:hypothetical protein